MWNKTGMKFCWNCSAILPYKLVKFDCETCSGEMYICLKCNKEIKPPKEKDETAST